MGLYLVHGDEFLVLNEIRKLKKEISMNQLSYFEIFCDDSNNINISEYLNNISFFEKNVFIIRNILEEQNHIHPIIQDFIEILEKKADSLLLNNDIYFFHYGKIPNNNKIYKLVSKIGFVKEFKPISPEEIIQIIKKKLKINNELAFKISILTKNNLLRLKNELDKLSNLEKITLKDIELLIPNISEEKIIWNLGGLFVNFLLTKNKDTFKNLVNEVNLILSINNDEMIIIYSFYSVILNLIKMKLLKNENKNYKDLISSINYFFVKKYYIKSDKLNIEHLYEINKLLTELEYEIKIGNITPTNAIRKFILNFTPYNSI